MNIDTSCFSTNIGPDARKELLNKAALEYDNGRIDTSIFYQVQAMFSTVQDRYFNMSDTPFKSESKYRASFTKSTFKNINDPAQDQNHDHLLKYAKETLKLTADDVSYDFLHQLPNPDFGMIMETCKQFPREWTILQVCKGPRPQTTYSICDHIYQRDGDIYLALLQHARSFDYPEPICLRFSEITQIKLFEDFFKIAKKCKEYMQVDCKGVLSREDKVKYFEKLNILEKNIKEAINTLKQYFFPWLCLFRGVPNECTREYQKMCYAAVDELCSMFKLKQKERVLLSLVALHAANLTKDEIESISKEISDDEKSQEAARQLLNMLQGSNIASSTSTTAFDQEGTYKPSHYPCILIVDEHLDHIFWEELNTAQEMCRVNSLHCLQKLYTMHKAKIHKGYVCLDIKTGSCIINPENNLPKTQMRLQAFFDYWTPAWQKICGKKPLQEELLEDYFKRCCYVYAGHGSGLQFISGRYISKQQIDAVVFLFGCDSTRMCSSGLYSDFVGPHIYYHAAMCPCLVGAILPALDAQMDGIACELLSRWIAPPDKKNFVSWQDIDIQYWTKNGIILPSAKNTAITTNDLIRYQIGSLCGIITRIHMRKMNKLYYNTVPYVCRGLPVWNINAQPLFK